MTISPPRYTITLRDSLYQELEVLDYWTSLTLIRRFNKTGTWNLELPVSTVSAGFLSPRSGIVVRRDGLVVFSGSITTDYLSTKNTLKVSGTDDNVLLENVTRPTPSLNFGPFPDEYDVTTGIASTIMRSLVDRNIGPSAPSSWKIPHLSLAPDPVVGDIITARSRFDPLITLLAELASTPIATGLGFKIQQSDTVVDTLEFSIYVPRDKHIDTIFSVDLNTISDYEYRYTLPQANYFYVGGGDDFGSNRTIVEGGDTDSIIASGRLISVFVDKRGVTDTGELLQELAQQIATSVTSEQVTVITSDTSTLRDGVDYDLGDYVTAVARGIQYPRLIREMEYDFDVNRGVIIKPLVADPNGSNDSIDSQHLSTLENRISNIERNWNVPEDSITQSMLHPFMKWNVGDIKMTALGAAQPGWMMCIGSILDSTVYPELFAAIGTQFGIGGVGTFALPDFRNRFPIGAGTDNILGASVDVTTLPITFSYSHSHGMPHVHSVAINHTHPGHHNHDAGALKFSHTHVTDLNHDHPTITHTSGTQNTTDLTAHNPLPNTSTAGHDHAVDIPALGTTNRVSLSQSTSDVTGTTGDDSNAPPAVYTTTDSGPAVPASTEPDIHDFDLTTAYTDPSRVAINFEIFVGV